ncbi:hypothetical protein [Marinobacterium stanieri]|uniref:hypothetical protein n=1 Tax=Marinobacterium stanieri TaxID=49186 RepID=UPI0002558F12|nr:hypothetical protein [Marinobacterium stanieri]
MNTTSDIIPALDWVKERLERINKANGYNSDPSVERGWLQMIVNQDRLRRNEITFPVIAYRPALTEPKGSTEGNSSLIDSVTVMVEGAVLTKDSDTPVDDLLNLIKDVRRSLVFDPTARKLKVSKLTIQDCPFDLPESGEDYAFFSQKITFEVTEQYAESGT